MNNSKFLIAGIAGGITYFLLGWIVYGMLMMSFFDANHGGATGVMRTDENMVWWALILGNLSFGFLLSYIFNKWANITSLAAGFAAGAVISFFVGAAYDLTMYGTSDIMNLKGTMVDIVLSTVVGGVVGGVVGLVSGMGKKPA